MLLLDSVLLDSVFMDSVLLDSVLLDSVLLGSVLLDSVLLDTFFRKWTWSSTRELLEQGFLAFFPPWTLKSQKNSRASQLLKCSSGSLNTCMLKRIKRVQYFNFVIFAEPTNQCFSTFFESRHLTLVIKQFGGTTSHNLLVNGHQVQNLEAPLKLYGASWLSTTALHPLHGPLVKNLVCPKRSNKSANSPSQSFQQKYN